MTLSFAGLAKEIVLKDQATSTTEIKIVANNLGLKTKTYVRSRKNSTEDGINC